KAINPACMYMFDEFIAVGTHGKIERPGKATQFFPCDTIDGPIVLLKDGTVMRVNDVETANKIKAQLEKIIYVGDLLSTYGDFRKSAHPLVPPGYVEEWWKLELEKIVEENKDSEKLKEFDIVNILKNFRDIDEELGIKLSEKLGVALHP